MNTYYVYILASKPQGVLYIGVTNELRKRLYEHMNNKYSGFTSKYHVYQLMYFEEYSDIEEAIHREKCLKRWKRDWKIKLIEESNLEWKNLYYEIKN